MSDKTIFRRMKNRNNPYVMIDKEIFENRTLSWKAKGLLGYLLSRPDDWIVRMTDLAKRSSEGMAAVRTAVKELEEAGYMVRRRGQDDDGKFQWTVEVHEVPVSPSTENHKMDDEPSTDFPSMENPLVENRTLLSTKVLSTENTKKEPVSPDDLFPPVREPPPRTEPSILEKTDPLSLAAAVAARGGGEKSWTVTGPEGVNPYEGEPLAAMCELLRMPEPPPPKKRDAWVRRLEQIGEGWGAGPQVLADAIRAIRDSEDHNWRSFSSPFASTFEEVVGVMITRVRNEDHVPANVIKVELW